MPWKPETGIDPLMRRLPLLAIATMLFASSARAQNVCPSCLDSIAGQWHMLPAVGLRAGTPQKVSAALGLVTGRNYRERGSSEDVAVYVEPGLSAGRATLAFLSGFGNMGTGFGVGGTVMRTWRDPWTVPANTTLVGGELWAWPVFFTGPRVGLFREVTGTSHRWFLTADFGFGL
jgi:hypothetical protein